MKENGNMTTKKTKPIRDWTLDEIRKSPTAAVTEFGLEPVLTRIGSRFCDLDRHRTLLAFFGGDWDDAFCAYAKTVMEVCTAAKVRTTLVTPVDYCHIRETSAAPLRFFSGDIPEFVFRGLLGQVPRGYVRDYLESEFRRNHGLKKCEPIVWEPVRFPR